MVTTASGPAAENSSRPTVATPRHGARALATRVSATRSWTSSGRASLLRTSGGVVVVGALMRCSDQVVHVGHSMPTAPGRHFLLHAQRRPRVGERRRPDLHGVG